MNEERKATNQWQRSLCISIFPTCVEDHEVISWTPSQKASVHIDVVSHSNRAVSDGSEGHAPDCQAIPSQSHCSKKGNIITAVFGFSGAKKSKSTNKAEGVFLHLLCHILTYIKAIDSRETVGSDRAGHTTKQIQLAFHNTEEETRQKYHSENALLCWSHWQSTPPAFSSLVWISGAIRYWLKTSVIYVSNTGLLP